MHCAEQIFPVQILRLKFSNSPRRYFRDLLRGVGGGHLPGGKN